MVFAIDIMLNTALLVKLRNVNRRKALFDKNGTGFWKFQIIENSIKNLFNKNFHYFSIYFGVIFV